MAQRLSLENARKIRKHMYLLKVLAKAGKRRRQNILMTAPSAFFKVLDLIFQNCLSGKISIQKQHLKKHRKFMQKNSNKSFRTIKDNIVQDGGGFSLLLAGLIPVIGNLLSSLIK